jgi:hypothetical protein
MSVWNNFIALIGLILVDLLVTTTRASLLNARWPYLYSLREKNLSEADRTIDLLQRPNLTVALRLAGSTMHFLVLTAGVLLIMQVYPMFPNPAVLGDAWCWASCYSGCLNSRWKAWRCARWNCRPCV